MTKLLLVEDEADLRFVIETQVRQAGLDCQTASTLEEARERLAGSDFDAVLLDLVLGEESGWALAEEIGGPPGPGPVVIVISAYAAPDTLARARAGGFEWLPKPFTTQELLALLDRLIPGRHQGPRPPGAS